MKKLLSGLMIFTVVSSTSVNVLSCGRKTFGTDLSKLEDYSWNKEEPYFKNYNEVSTIDSPENFKDLGKVEASNKAEFFDISKINTGFKTQNEIAKQATTGVPLNSKFLPNGGRLSDVQLIEKKDYYTRINKLVDWKYDQDLDAKYNKSRIKLQDSEKVQDRWVDSQDKRVKEMNMSTIIDSTSNENTIVGRNRTYERSFNNYQYNDILVSWAGAIDEGIIVPPGKNQVEKAHINGTKILGNIFLDGYHGLTKESISGFLEKDNSGNYLVVDVLIEMAKKLGFDGWFWNNEPNGSNPSGFVVDYNITVEIMRQLQEKIKKSEDEEIKNLMVIGYKNYGSLAVDKNGTVSDKESEQIYNNTNQFLNDFYVFPNEVKAFTDAKNIKDKKFDIYNMFNAGAWVGGKIWLDSNKIGTRDYRDLTHLLVDESGIPYDSTNAESMKKLQKDYMDPNGKVKFAKADSEYAGAQNSLSLFAGHVPYDLASQDMDKISSEKSMDLDTYGMVAANNYDDILYTGKKKSLANDDIGLAYFPSNKFDDEISKYPHKYSYGVGNIVAEKTTLIDSNKKFITNFSTGQGNRFATLDGSSKYEIKNFPWSNTNIADVQPTYKWMVKNREKQISAFDGISGYYDYYDPYLKGNSIALGSGYDNNGKIKEASWTKGEKYDWTIMGSNYLTNENKNVEIIFKAPEEIANTVQLSLKDSNNVKTNTNMSTPTNLGNGWWSIKQDVASSISKIGINFTAVEDKFKINVGQISVVKGDSKNLLEDSNPQTKIQSELEISRGDIKNLRLNFENLIDESIYSYYEIYKKNANDKLTLIGMSNSDNYFIKNIDKNTNEFYLKTTNNLTKKIEWIKFEI
ncbi:endo-beta-N-acetylglucosaminidase [Spiroplasma floricola]|uniref:Endo-beta-N-acetylglucosaminidase n=1 Tax=Spiroplasma floricola 23-6 TaxID=1336749 RepID=A0A2K8SDL6_9MOLU|nr:hypothetical protein [Spiroplasma floricola]AUB31551.1 endo-beta-N-acetylglucosaminidase [Spiroplasma floricola 23-6]